MRVKGLIHRRQNFVKIAYSTKGHQDDSDVLSIWNLEHHVSSNENSTLLLHFWIRTLGTGFDIKPTNSSLSVMYVKL